MSAMSFFQGLGPWNWFLIAIVLFGLEMLTPGIHLLWFGLAAIVTGVMGLALGISWQWQLVAYAILSVVAMFMARSFSLKRGARTDTPGLNQRGTEYIGRTVVVEEAIRGGRGKVRAGFRRDTRPDNGHSGRRKRALCAFKGTGQLQGSLS